MEDLSKIIDDELKNKTNDIAEQFGAVGTSKSEKEEFIIEEDLPIEKSKEDEKKDILKEKKTKRDIISDILEIQKKLNRDEFTESVLMKNRKDELEKILALQFEKLMNETTSKKKAIESCSDAVVKNMFLANVLLAGLIEKGGDLAKKKTYDINLMEGLREKFSENEKELLTILKRIYLEHSEILEKYCTPFTLYAGFMMKMISFTAMENLKKKKVNSSEESEEESKNTESLH